MRGRGRGAPTRARPAARDDRAAPQKARLHSTGSTRKLGLDEDAHALAAGVAADADACFLSNRTCELGTTRATL